MDVLTLNDDEEKELYRLHRLYWKEAVRCEEVKKSLSLDPPLPPGRYQENRDRHYYPNNAWRSRS